MWSICTLLSAVHSIFLPKDWSRDIWEFSFITLKQIELFPFDTLDSALADSVMFQKNQNQNIYFQPCALNMQEIISHWCHIWCQICLLLNRLGPEFRKIKIRDIEFIIHVFPYSDANIHLICNVTCEKIRLSKKTCGFSNVLHMSLVQNIQVTLNFRLYIICMWNRWNLENSKLRSNRTFPNVINLYITFHSPFYISA